MSTSAAEQEQHDQSSGALTARLAAGVRNGATTRLDELAEKREEQKRARDFRQVAAAEILPDLDTEQGRQAHEKERQELLSTLRHQREAWMLGVEGLEGLNEAQTEKAQRAYAKWRHRDDFVFENYVDYVQARWAERLERHGGIDALEASLAELQAQHERDQSAREEQGQEQERDDKKPESEPLDALDDDDVHDDLDQEQGREAEPAFAHLSPKDALEAAVKRVTQIAEQARAARVRDTEIYQAKKLPEYPRNSPRCETLARAVTTPAHSPLPPAQAATLDRLARQIREEIVNNPLWIAADYIDRHTKLERADYGLLENERVQEAKALYRRCETRVQSSKREQEAFLAQPSWRRSLENKLTNKEEQLHQKRLGASKQLIAAKQALDAVKAQLQSQIEFDVADRNARALRARDDARVERDTLEQGLRDALGERALAELSFENERVALKLQQARPGEALEYAGALELGPFSFHEFRGTDGQRYLGDATEMRGAFEKLALNRGDRVEPRLDRRGQGSLHLLERGDTWPRDHAIEGRVLEVEQQQGGQISGIKLLDQSSGIARWVRPTYGDDLAKDFSEPVLRQIALRDVVQLEGNSISVRAEHEQGLGR